LVVEKNIDMRFLFQLDKLVKLLEMPIFTHLRLQLLEPRQYPWLLKTLYGLLMLFPQQSVAFRISKKRLKTVPTYTFNGEELNLSALIQRHGAVIYVSTEWQRNLNFS
jgi:vacuole morphology and inheritance protein 14